MARYTSSSRRRRRMPAAGRRKTEYREKVFSPEEKDEIDLTDEILAEAMLPEIMGEPAGGHVKEDVYITKLLEDSMPKIHEAHKGSHIQAVETGTVAKFQEQKQRKKPVKNIPEHSGLLNRKKSRRNPDSVNPLPCFLFWRSSAVLQQ